MVAGRGRGVRGRRALGAVGDALLVGLEGLLDLGASVVSVTGFLAGSCLDAGARSLLGDLRDLERLGLLRRVRVLRAGVHLQLLDAAGGRAGSWGACPRRPSRRPGAGPSRAARRTGSRRGRPGSRSGGRPSSWSRLSPDSATLSALTMMTKSPPSMCGANVGLCLPRSRVAAWTASRPSTTSVASMTCHSRWMSAGFGLYVRTLLLSRVADSGVDGGSLIGSLGQTGQSRTKAAATDRDYRRGADRGSKRARIRPARVTGIG